MGYFQTAVGKLVTGEGSKRGPPVVLNLRSG